MIQVKTDAAGVIVHLERFFLIPGYVLRIETGDGRREYIGPFDKLAICRVENDRLYVRVKCGREVNG